MIHAYVIKTQEPLPYFCIKDKIKHYKERFSQKRATLDTTIKKDQSKGDDDQNLSFGTHLPNTLLKIDETQAPIPLIQAKRSLSQIIIIIFTDFSSFLFLP